MTTKTGELKRYHDVTALCLPAEDADKQKKTEPLKNAFYDADLKAVVATNGALALAAPVESDLGVSGMIESKALSIHADKGGSITKNSKGEPVIGKAHKVKLLDDSYPRVGNLFYATDPDFVVHLGVDALAKLVEYATANDVDGITLAINHNHGKTWKERTCTDAVRILMDAPDGDECAVIRGLLMPCKTDVAETEARIESVKGGKKLLSGNGKPTSSPKTKKTKPSTAGKSATKKLKKKKALKPGETIEDLLKKARKLAAVAENEEHERKRAGYFATARKYINRAISCAKSDEEMKSAKKSLDFVLEKRDSNKV